MASLGHKELIKGDYNSLWCQNLGESENVSLQEQVRQDQQTRTIILKIAHW